MNSPSPLREKRVSPAHRVWPSLISLAEGGNTAALYIEVLDFSGSLGDELAARFHLVPHEYGEDAIGAHRILQLHAQYGAAVRIHGRLPELFGVHLAQPLVALHMYAARIPPLLEEPRLLPLGEDVPLGLTALETVERRLGDVDVSLLDQCAELPVEEGEEKRTDVGTVHVGVGHDYDAVVAQFGGVEIVSDLAQNLPQISGDREALLRMAGNLIRNAVEAMPGGGTLTVATALREDGQVEMRFSDTGGGIAQEVRERLFLPYVTSKPDGTGLGLVVVKEIVGQHDGEIGVDSGSSKGTSIWVALPALRGA